MVCSKHDNTYASPINKLSFSFPFWGKYSKRDRGRKGGLRGIENDSDGILFSLTGWTAPTRERHCHERFGDFSPTLKRQAVYIGRRYATCKCHSTYKRRSHDRFMSKGFQPVAEKGGCNEVSTRCRYKIKNQRNECSFR